MEIYQNTVLLSDNFELNVVKYNAGTPFNLLVEPVVYDVDQALWANKASNIPIYKVQVSYVGVFEPFDFYYLRDVTFYPSLQDAIDQANAISTVGINPLINFVFATGVAKLARFNANEDTILLSPPVYDYDYGPFPDTCTIETGGYTIICKWLPFFNESTFSGSFDYSYTYTDENNDEITTVTNTAVKINIEIPNNLGETGGATDTVVTITIGFPNSYLVTKTITEPHASFPLTDTVVPTITSGLNEYDEYFLDLDEITYTFSGEIIFPQELRVSLPNAYFTGDGGVDLEENIDEILTLDLETGIYVSDIKNYYNIPGRLMIETFIWGPSGTGFKFFIGGTFFPSYQNQISLIRMPIGKRLYNNKYRDYNSEYPADNRGIDEFSAVISDENNRDNNDNGLHGFTDFSYKINSIAVVKDGYIAPRFKLYVDTIDETGNELDQDGHGFRYGLSFSGKKTHAVFYASFTSCTKNYGNEPIYPWMDGNNFFKQPRFYLASQHEDAFISSVRIGTAPNAPTITSSNEVIYI